MKQIITIQHTQSIHHTNGMVGSWTDWDLSELGIEQAERIGQKLAKQLSGHRFHRKILEPTNSSKRSLMRAVTM